MNEHDKYYMQVLKFQEEKEQRKGKVGADRYKKMDDVFSSQIDIGMLNPRLPSNLQKDVQMTKPAYMSPDVNLNVIDMDKIYKPDKKKQELQKYKQINYDPNRRNLDPSYDVSNVRGGRAGRGTVDG